jgi:hypothetical protein
MKWPTIGIIAACVALLPHPAFSKSSLILPKADFPAHTTIKVYRNVSNAAFDHAQGCLASFGDPFFHDVCAGALNRTGGWVQTGIFFGKKVSTRQIGFDIVASSFQSPADAERAYNDFVSTVQGPDWGGYWSDAPRSITVDPSSSAAEFSLSDRADGVWGETIIESSGPTEIEAVSFWSERKDSARAKSFLSKEMADAIAIGLTPLRPRDLKPAGFGRSSELPDSGSAPG